MPGKFDHKVCFITGSTGIAAATAELASQEGAQVFITSRTVEHGELLRERIRSTGGDCEFFSADLSIQASAAAAIDRCFSRFGRIDTLFNVAGISGRKFGDGPIHECTPEGWDMTMNTNVKSMFFVCGGVVMRMLQQPIQSNGLRGVILNMASVLAFSPSSQYFATHAYAASKGAIIALTKSMAAYYAPMKIRVNAIAPGLVRTPMSQRAQANAAVLDFMQSKQPLLEDLIAAADVARAALFLLSDDANMITGDVLQVDAGWCVSG